MLDLEISAPFTAGTTSAQFTQINATVAGKKDMEAVVSRAKEVQGIAYSNKSIPKNLPSYIKSNLTENLSSYFRSLCFSAPQSKPVKVNLSVPQQIPDHFPRDQKPCHRRHEYH